MFRKVCNSRINPGSSVRPSCRSHCTILSTFRRISRIVLTLLLVSTPVRAAEVVAVFADQSRGPFEAPVGFLHGVDDTLMAADRGLVADLHPKHWRLAKFETYAEAVEFDGVQITYQVEAPIAWNKGYSEVKPWENWAAYETYVRLMVQSRNSWFPDHPVAFWDVWNEPDRPAFWTGTRDQLLQLFALTYATIKDEDPDAQVVGPSLSCYDPQDPGLENIIDFLVDLDTQYGIRLDAISWHENGAECAGGPHPWHIYSNTAALRADLAAHFGPDYNPPLHINEYAGSRIHLSPGWNVAYLFYLIEAGVDAAMRSCWRLCEDYQQPLFAYADCWAGLDGLFTYPGDTPQAAYWVYKAAADMESGDRLPTQSQLQTNVIAARDDSSETIRILIGRHDYGYPSDVSVQVQGYPFPHERVRVDVRRIPNSWASCLFGDAWIPKTNAQPFGPIDVSTSLISVVDGAFNIDLADFAESDAYVLTISPPRFIPAMSNGGQTALVILLGSIGAILVRRARRNPRR